VASVVAVVPAVLAVLVVPAGRGDTVERQSGLRGVPGRVEMVAGVVMEVLEEVAGGDVAAPRWAFG